MPYPPDPAAAIAAYGAPDVQPPMVSDQALLGLPSPQVPDPRAALAVYQGQPMPETSGQALGQINNAMSDQQASNTLRAQAAADAADQAATVQSEAGVDAMMHGEELKMAQEEHKAEIGKIVEDGENVGERSMMSRIMGTIAVTLGGMQDQNNLVAGLKQGLNVQTHNAEQIASQINAQIERDIALQRAKLEGRTNASNQGYAENTQALQLAHAAKIEQAQAALQSIASQAQSKDVIESVNGANAKLEQDKQALNMNVLSAREKARAAAAAGGPMRQLAILSAQQKLQLGQLEMEGKALSNAHQEIVNKGGGTPAEIADLEGKMLANRKAMAELAQGPKLTEAQQKMDIQVAGVKPSFERIQKMVTNDDGSPKVWGKDKIDLPSYGVTRGAWLPDNIIPTDNLQYRADVLDSLAAVLRAESGSNIPPAEVELKAEAKGLFSKDEEIRLRGLQSLSGQIRAMDVKGRLKPPMVSPEIQAEREKYRVK